MVTKEYNVMKMKDDPKLEKLFEGMSRETAKKIANQGSPTKRTPTKKTAVKKADTKKK